MRSAATRSGRAAAAAAGAMLALGACQATVTEPPASTPPTAATAASTTVPLSTAMPTTTITTVARSGAWPAGTITCAELEGTVPVGIDDSDANLDTGLLTFHWGAAQSATVQFLDDPTCTRDSDAWRFVIGHNLEPELLHRLGRLCDFYAALTGTSLEGANVAALVEYLAAAQELCR